MSIRSIVEINHDMLTDLINHPEKLTRWLQGLKSAPTPLETLYGVTLLTQRHHADGIGVVVNGQVRYSERKL